ncbi:iron uptake porin [Cyanobacterium aponinum UTEX 3222]|uniref:iron uptake porin n=1 Tax=Cyanobacterium aponinum TaxID=379064 RepID=UPI003093DCB6|nr:iron uptake porin [Cyanobacterium aponinum UTEX 3222]
MKKNFWQSITVTPIIVGASLLANSPAKAGEEINLAQANNDSNTQIINQLDSYGAEGGVTSQDQVTSVSQLRDVSPTDWAFEALRSLVERYGCIVGYPDRTYRGNRALSRYEFAAGLNACMQQMERLIASSESVLREDIEKLKRLMSEFEAELAALGARVDNLEGRVAFLEDHQFSTTTKLQGEVIIALTQAFEDGNQAILGNRVRLVLNTSFTGEDNLVTRLSAGNFGAFNTTGTNRYRTGGLPITNVPTSGSSGTTNQTFNLYPGSGNDVLVDWLAYYAPIKLGKDSQIQAYLAAFGGIHSDYTPTLNPFFEDYDGGNGALSTFASENPIYRIGGGSGAGLSYQLGFLEGLLGPSTLTVGYLAGGASSAASPADGEGIFNGDYALLSQLNFNLSDTVALGFTYVNAFQKADTALFGGGGTAGIVGTTFANQSASALNERFQSRFPGATVDQKDKIVNSYGSQFAWRITDSISFSAFFNYSNVTRIGRGNDDIWTYGGGFAFPDLGKEGSVLGIFAGVQPYNASPTYFITDAAGNSRRVRVSSTTLPVHVEAFYKYQLTDNISLTPGVIWVNSTNQGQNDDQIIGTLRTTFTF